MQTFLPYPCFESSARVLDMRRLGKQRVECKQIYNALTEPTAKGWVNHPCTRMWKNHEMWLILYACAICREWRRRGYKDTLLDYFASVWPQAKKLGTQAPPWLGAREFHASHQSNLMRKFPQHYMQFNWPVPLTLEYIWPVSKETYHVDLASIPNLGFLRNHDVVPGSNPVLDSSLLRPVGLSPARLRVDSTRHNRNHLLVSD